jgi:hypothetical protein
MANELQQQTKAIGLKVNANKTKLLTNQNIDRHPPFIVDTQQVERVDKFVYLGQLLGNTTKRNEEIGRRISAGWRSFFKYKFIFSSKSTPMAQKRRLFNQCILPAMLYGAETWAITKAEETRLSVAQRRMERIMAGISLQNRRTNEWLRQTTKVTDIVKSYRRRKWNRARRIAKMDDDRWTKRVTEWQPRIGRRGRGRPKRRWRDNFVHTAGVNWMAIARNDTNRWRLLGEEFLRS